MQELCELEYVSFHYKLPVVAEEVLELVPVQYPEPEEECLEVETAEIETECRHKEDNHCVSCAHIRSSNQESSADQVHQTSYGDCEERELSLPQTRCVLYCTVLCCTVLYCIRCVREQRIKTVGPSQGPRSVYRGQRGHGSAFTAFQ